MKTRKILSLILCLAIVFSFASTCFCAEFSENVYAESYLVLDLTTGKTLASKNAQEKNYPASLTKMLTAIVAYEYYIKQPYGLETKVTADEEAASAEPTKFWLKDGETMPVDEALNIMLVMSANDIAVMLAKNISGTVDIFARRLNSKAEEIGCTNTNFVTPNGLHDDNHYSTAEDLAKIAQYFLSIPYLADIVAQDHYDYDATNCSSAGTVTSSNYLYSDTRTIYVGNTRTTTKYENGTVLGVKTGTTTEAGGCLVARVKSNYTDILVVILNSRSSEYSYLLERYADAHLLLDWAFDNFVTINAFEKGTELGIVKVKKGEFNKVTAVAAKDVFSTLESGEDRSVITTEISLDKSIKAPFEAGTKIGTVNVYNKGILVESIDAVTAVGINEGGFLSNFGIEDATAKKIYKICLIILFVIIFIFAVLMIIRTINISKRNKRRKELEERKAKIEKAKALKEERFIKENLRNDEPGYYFTDDYNQD